MSENGSFCFIWIRKPQEEKRIKKEGEKTKKQNNRKRFERWGAGATWRMEGKTPACATAPEHEQVMSRPPGVSICMARAFSRR